MGWRLPSPPSPGSGYTGWFTQGLSAQALDVRSDVALVNSRLTSMWANGVTFLQQWRHRYNLKKTKLSRCQSGSVLSVMGFPHNL